MERKMRKVPSSYQRNLGLQLVMMKVRFGPKVYHTESWLLRLWRVVSVLVARAHQEAVLVVVIVRVVGAHCRRERRREGAV